MTIKKCSVCGGDMIIKGNSFVCTFCGNTDRLHTEDLPCDEKREKLYKKTLAEFSLADTETEFRRLAGIFKKLDDYKESRALQYLCLKEATDIFDKNMYVQSKELLNKHTILDTQLALSKLSRITADYPNLKETMNHARDQLDYLENQYSVVSQKNIRRGCNINKISMAAVILFAVAFININWYLYQVPVDYILFSYNKTIDQTSIWNVLSWSLHLNTLLKFYIGALLLYSILQICSYPQLSALALIPFGHALLKGYHELVLYVSTSAKVSWFIYPFIIIWLIMFAISVFAKVPDKNKNITGEPQRNCLQILLMNWITEKGKTL